MTDFKFALQYLLDAYETRVAQLEKQKLLKPVPNETIWEMQVGLSLKHSGATWWQQYYILFWRGLKQRRHDYLSWIRVTQVLATAVIVGLLWWRSNASIPNKIQDQVGICSMHEKASSQNHSFVDIFLHHALVR